jgi:hypothetical protein
VQFSHPLDQVPLPIVEKLMVQDERVEVPSHLERKAREERVDRVCVQAAVERAGRRRWRAGRCGSAERGGDAMWAFETGGYERQGGEERGDAGRVGEWVRIWKQLEDAR